MDQPVVGLAREIPKDCLTLGPVRATLAQGGKHPELLPVRRSLLLECAVDHAITQCRFAHAVIAHQHDLARRVWFIKTLGPNWPSQTLAALHILTRAHDLSSFKYEKRFRREAQHPAAQDILHSEKAFADAARLPYPDPFPLLVFHLCYRKPNAYVHLPGAKRNGESVGIPKSHFLLAVC